MRTSLLAAAAAGLCLLALVPARPAHAASSPSPPPSPSAPPACPPAASPSPAPPTPTPTPGSLQDLCAQKQLLDQARARLGGSLAGALSAQDQLKQSLAQNAGAQETLRAGIGSARQQVAALDRDLAAREADIAATGRRIAAERAQVAAFERALYFQPDNLLVRLLQAGSLREMLVEAADLTTAADRGHAVQKSLETDLSRLDADQARQRDDRRRQTDLASREAADLQKIEGLQAQQQQTSARLATSIALTQAELQKINSQQAALADRISKELEAEQQQLIATAMQQVWQQVALWLQANPALAVAQSPGHSRQYRFIWPEPQGVVTQGFGPSQLPFEPAFDGFPHFHTGVDVAGPMGTPVLAADDGVVAVVGSGSTGYGNYVVLAHGAGLTTLYGHLEQSLVKVGDRVVQGQPLGLEGSTGYSTGPHVHFEVRAGGVPVDPLPYLPPGPPSAFRG